MTWSAEPQSERQMIVEGVAAFAISLAEMGTDEDAAHSQLVGMMARLRETDPELVREAAAAVSAFPQPLDESPDEIERARPIREMLGVRTASEELDAVLRAREWLQRLADDLAGRQGVGPS